MPFGSNIDWTSELDAKLRELRLACRTWDQIAAEMGLGRNTVLERGRKIGVPRGKPVPAPTPQTNDDPEREALPAGSPETWLAINAGTVLDGAPYPHRTHKGRFHHEHT